MTYNSDFSDFIKYVMGNHNLIDAIHDIERNPVEFSRRMRGEIEKFGFSRDTAASEIRCELIGYLLLHKEDAIGFEIGKHMFNRMKKDSGEHIGEVWCFLIGEGLQRLLEASCKKSDASTMEYKNMMYAYSSRSMDRKIT